MGNEENQNMKKFNKILLTLGIAFVLLFALYGFTTAASNTYNKLTGATESCVTCQFVPSSEYQCVRDGMLISGDYWSTGNTIQAQSWVSEGKCDGLDTIAVDKWKCE